MIYTVTYGAEAAELQALNVMFFKARNLQYSGARL